MKIGTEVFAGLPRGLPGMLARLRDNNERPWFQGHREEYAALVTRPLRALGQALVMPMQAIDPDLALKVSRPNRDARFSRDKSPYRSSAWMAFQYPSSDWTSRPAFFVEMAPEGWRYGMGFYQATAATMRALRALAVERPAVAMAALAAAEAAGMTVMGEEYRRPPPELADLPTALHRLARRRSVHLEAMRPYDDAAFDVTLAPTLAGAFTAAEGLYRLFREARARGLEFI